MYPSEQECENCGTMVEDLGTLNMMCPSCGHVWSAIRYNDYDQDDDDYYE